MRPIPLIVAILVVSAHPAPAADAWDTLYCCLWPTNAAAITNGSVVLSAVIAGDAQSKANVQALIGASVVFAGYGGADQGVNLTTRSNVIIHVEIQPARTVTPRANGWNAEVLGILLKVDFDNTAIYIRARPEDWRWTSAS